MADSASPTTPARGLSDAALILALGLLVLVPQLFTRDLWGPDETRFAEVAREMRVTGDYLVPHLNGRVYAEKPPVFFWLANALWPCVGPNAGRGVSLLSALGSLLLIQGIGRRLYGRQAGLLAAAVALSMLLFLTLSKIGILDPLLLFAVLLAISAGLEAMGRKGARPSAWWLGFYAAAALGVLIKGPVALMAAGAVILAYGLVCRRSVSAGAWWHLPGAALLLALVAAWLVPALIVGGPAYTDRLLIQQTVDRVAGSGSHGEPFYYYLLWWPAYFFPWSLLLPVAIASAVRAVRREGRPADWLPLLWFAVLFGLFSLISGKGERYLLPTVPAAALLVARYVHAPAADVLWPRLRRALTAATLALLGLAAVAAAVLSQMPASVAKRIGPDPELLQPLLAAFTPARTGLIAAVGALLALACLYALFRWRSDPTQARRAAAVVVATLALSVVTDTLAMPIVNPVKADARLVAQLKPYLDQADEVCYLKADFGGIVNLFTGRLACRELQDDAELLAALAAPRRVAVVSWPGSARRRPSPERSWVVTPPRVTSRTLVLILNWKPDAAPQPTPAR